MFGFIKDLKKLNKLRKIANKVKAYFKDAKNKKKIEDLKAVAETVKGLAPEFAADVEEFITYVKSL
jgi:uncharacterized membrane protein (DUF106 family)